MCLIHQQAPFDRCVLCSICATEAHDATLTMLTMFSDAAQIRFVRLCSTKETVTRHAYDSSSAKQSINLANGLPLSATTAEQLHDQGSWCPQIRLYSCATHFSLRYFILDDQNGAIQVLPVLYQKKRDPEGVWHQL